MIGKALFAFALAAAGPAQEALVALDGAGIRAALTGRLISYSPPGWADAGAHEEFHPGGIWRGMRYGRGTMPFEGHWEVRGDQLCVLVELGRWDKLPRPEWVCRTLWRDPKTGALRMNHIVFGEGPLVLTVSPLPGR